MSELDNVFRLCEELIPMHKATEIGLPGIDFVRKEDLVDGEYYYGSCRNTRIAKWVANEQVFVYIRHKFGTRFEEDIKYPTDEEHFDVFIPLYRCYPNEESLVRGDKKKCD